MSVSTVLEWKKRRFEDRIFRTKVPSDTEKTKRKEKQRYPILRTWNTICSRFIWDYSEQEATGIPVLWQNTQFRWAVPESSKSPPRTFTTESKHGHIQKHTCGRTGEMVLKGTQNHRTLKMRHCLQRQPVERGTSWTSYLIRPILLQTRRWRGASAQWQKDAGGSTRPVLTLRLWHDCDLRLCPAEVTLEAEGDTPEGDGKTEVHLGNLGFSSTGTFLE